MALNAKKVPKAGGNGSNFKKQDPVEPGTYPARLVQILDLGVQPQRPYKGTEKPPCQTIQLTWELVDEFMTDEEGNELEDKPRWISETMPFRNLESDLAKSTKRYKALDPKEEFEGDFSQLLGLPANVLLTTYQVKNGPNAGNENNAVDNVTAMRPRDAAKTPELVNEPKIFVLDEPDLEVFLSLPDFLQEKIKANLEYAGSPLQEALEGGSSKPKGKAKKAPEEAPEEPESDEQPDLGDDDDDMPWDD